MGEFSLRKKLQAFVGGSGKKTWSPNATRATSSFESSHSRSRLSRSRNKDSSQEQAPDASVSVAVEIEKPTLPEKADLLLDVFSLLDQYDKQNDRTPGKWNDNIHPGYRRTAKYSSIGHITAAASIFRNRIESIQQSAQVPALESHVTQVADSLESLFSDNVIALADIKEKGPVCVAYPRLSAICNPCRDWVNGDDVMARIHHELASHADEDWKAILDAMASLTDQIQHLGQDINGEKPELEQDRRSMITRRPLPGLAEFIAQTYTAIECTCNMHSICELGLELQTYRKRRGAELEDKVRVLAKEVGLHFWDELQIHGSEHFECHVDRDSSRSPKAPVQPPGHVLDEHGCICNFYHRRFRPEFWRLNLQLHEFKLSPQYWEDERELPRDSLTHQVNLKSMLAAENPVLSADGMGMAKMTLSVILAYSIFYLYGGSWAKGRWNRKNIMFFMGRDGIPMRPFLRVTASTQENQEEDRGAFHRYPEFLELGVMLLEINFGQSLESMLEMDKEIKSLDDCWSAASEVYSKRKYDIVSVGLRHAIETCLKPDFSMGLGPDGTGGPSNDELRNMLFESVVHPLEMDLNVSFQQYISIDALDEEASTKIRIPTRRRRPHLISSTSKSPVHFQQELDVRRKNSKLEPRSSSISRNDALSHSRSHSPLPLTIQLFSNDSKTSEGPSPSNMATEDWIARFQNLVQKHIPLGGCDRVKVAILDTGVDIDHPEFFREDSERIKKCQSWIESPPEQDTSGHGTHIASIILSLTHNVDLFVGKITESNTIEKTDHIADAITCASEEWDVDIISLSFGFPKGHRQIDRAINRAVQRDKIIFAAASNDGSNTSRAWPARHDRVIAIHSADGHGNRSAFNPTAEKDTDNFCVLGEHIQGAWLDAAVRRMSGTSFATPVAVAIAAFMIGFVSRKTPDHENWLIPLRSYSGMRAVFRILTQKRDGDYHLVNPLFHFSRSGNPEATILRLIEEELDE